MPRKKTIFADLPLKKQIETIEKALEKDVMPSLASHGGGIEIMDIQGSQIFIRYQGACMGCPLSSQGTLSFIEKTLQENVDKEIKVVPV